jgi:hypothetical protein
MAECALITEVNQLCFYEPRRHLDHLRQGPADKRRPEPRGCHEMDGIEVGNHEKNPRRVNEQEFLSKQFGTHYVMPFRRMAKVFSFINGAGVQSRPCFSATSF